MIVTTLEGGKTTSMHTTKSKDRSRDSIKSQIDKFIARGGKIQVAKKDVHSSSHSPAFEVSR